MRCFLPSLATALLLISSAHAAGVTVAGHIQDPQGRPVPNAVISLLSQDAVSVINATSSGDGAFQFTVNVPGAYTIRVKATGFPDLSQALTFTGAGVSDLTLAFTRVASQRTAVTVTADLTNADIEYPDPATKVYVRDQVLDANPGRPGAPISIPGYPIETASGGIKAPSISRPG